MSHPDFIHAVQLIDFFRFCVEMVRVGFTNLPERMFCGVCCSLIAGVDVTDIHTGARATFHDGIYQPPRNGIMMQLLAGATYTMEWRIIGQTTTYCPGINEWCHLLKQKSFFYLLRECRLWCRYSRRRTRNCHKMRT